MKQGVNLINMNENVVNLEEAKKILRQTAGNGSDENWLKDLVSGTIFLTKPKNIKDQKYCDQFCVVEHKEVATNLLQKLPTGQQLDLWYPSLEFSRNNTLIEVIAVVKFTHTQEQLEKDLQLSNDLETTDGQSDRAV